MSEAIDTYRILVVDDEQSLRQSYEDALAPAAQQSKKLADLEAELFESSDEHGDAFTFEVSACEQGLDAVKAVEISIAENRPFLVAFIDMRMPPGIDGVETAFRIRKIDPQINIVIVTGYSDTDVPAIAARVKPADKLFYLSKPLQVAEIRQQASVLSARWLAEANLIQQLRNQNESLSIAVEDARHARQQAVEASNTKSLFISNVSHELRTPLNSIIGFADILFEEMFGPLGDARYRDYSREISASGHVLLKSINELIDTARIDVGQLQLEIEDLDVSCILDRIIHDLSSYMSCKHIHQNSNFDPCLPWIKGDQKRVTQAISAVLQNAIKFAPEGSQISLSTVSMDHMVRIAVSDNGPGISMEIQERLQRTLAYEPGTYTRPQGGLGLGLWLARRLVEIQGGTLTINSRADQGTTIWLDFPVATLRKYAAEA